MAAIGIFHLLMQQNGRRNSRPRVFRQRNNPLQFLTDAELIERYRFHRAGLEEIISEIENDISPLCGRSHSLDPTTKTLVTLRYLAKGDFFSETGDIHGISRSSVSRAVAEVVAAINANLRNITFPDTDEAIRSCKQQFHAVAGIPNVVGALDGTLVPIVAPSENEQAYVCRKGYHALNVQAIVGPDLRFTNVVAKWPGSSHDATVFDNSRIKDHLESEHIGWLLGDSGYALKNYLITPKMNPQSEAEIRFNGAHSKTRIVVERAFGVLKSRFRCLHKTGGCLPFTPAKSCHVAEACMRLHNKAIQLGIPMPDVSDGDIGDFDNSVFEGQENLSGQHIRNVLINKFA